jgi:hypothetical protein
MNMSEYVKHVSHHSNIICNWYACLPDPRQNKQQHMRCPAAASGTNTLTPAAPQTNTPSIVSSGTDTQGNGDAPSNTGASNGLSTSGASTDGSGPQEIEIKGYQWGLPAASRFGDRSSGYDDREASKSCGSAVIISLSLNTSITNLKLTGRDAGYMT